MRAVALHSMHEQGSEDRKARAWETKCEKLQIKSIENNVF